MITPKIIDLLMPFRIIGRLKKYNADFLKVLLFTAVMVTGLADIVHAMAAPPGGGGEAQGPGAMIQSFLPLILIFAIFYFLLIRPQSKKAKEHKQMLTDLKKGDKVMTNGGIHGIIEDIDGETITLKIGIKDDVRIKINRNFISSIR
jgi:preprotein translocase subunit YajC